MKKVLTLLLILGFAVNCFAAGEQTSYVKTKFLGINPRVSPKLLSDDESVDASNITLDTTGAIRDRDIFGQYNNSSGILGGNAITGLFKYYTSSSKYFIGCAGSKVALGSGGAFSTDISPTTNTVTSGTFWSACTFKENEYLFNSSVPMMKYDTLKSALYSPISIPATNCAYGTTHKSRVWAARADSTPYRIYWSSLNNGDDWGTTGGYLDLPDTTQSITGLISWGGYLWIFTETNIYVLQGSTPNDFSLRKTNSQVGAIAPRSIKITDVGIIFLARTGVFAFDGNNSNKLSDKVETLINDISKTSIQNACAIYDGQGKYWLSYTHKTGSYNNRILVYDTILKEWYPYDNLNINYFERAYGGTDKGELYGGTSISNGIVWLLQASSGTESFTHSAESDFLNGTTFNTVIQNDPYVGLQHGSFTDSFTKLLCHFNGTDGGTSYITDDYGKRVVSFFGTAQLDSAQKKFNTTSLLLNGSSDYLNIPDDNDWSFGTDAFTIDFWVRFNSLQSCQIIEQYEDSTHFWQVYYSDVGHTLQFATQHGGVATSLLSFQSSWTPIINTWYHIGIVRIDNTNSSNAWRIFIDGNSQTLTKTNGDWDSLLEDFIGPLFIGCDGSLGNFVNGWIDEVRISKGVARWTSNFTTPNTEYHPSRDGTLTSRNIQINSAGSSNLDIISWIKSEPTSDMKLTFQTRTGVTDDSVYFNGWQYWSSANSVTFDTVTSNTTAFTSSDNTNFAVSRSTALSRNILYYEDEKNTSPNYIMFVTKGAISKNTYADWTVPVKNLSSYSWLSGWYKSPETGNSVEFWIGENSPKYQVTFNTVNPNTWEKWYWYIGNITSTDIDAINHIRVKYEGDTAGNVVIGETSAYNFYTTGDVMTSTPNDWIQYRMIDGTNEVNYAPLLTSVTLAYTPASGNLESSLSSYYKTKWLDFQSPQINKQFTDFFVDIYTDSASDLQPIYFDYDIDNGAKTGTITIPSSNTVTNNTIKVREYFPSSTFGKTMQINYRNPNAKTSKHTIEGLEIRMRNEPLGN